MNNFVNAYLEKQRVVLSQLPAGRIVDIVNLFRQALAEDRTIFVFGNGGSAANASHFVTDLGKGSSDKTYKRFRCLSLNDNTSWMTALGNDYSYEDIFLRQLQNFAKPKDIAFTMSVSGNSPNLVKALAWCREQQITTVALTGNRRGKLAEMADFSIIVEDEHYGRVEDAHMTICHMIAYAFMELPELQAP